MMAATADHSLTPEAIDRLKAAFTELQAAVAVVVVEGDGGEVEFSAQRVDASDFNSPMRRMTILGMTVKARLWVSR